MKVSVRWLVIGVLVVGVAVLGVGLWSRFNRAAPTHRITGELTLAADCRRSTGGYDDIRQGAAVTVKDEKGTLIGTGALGPGAKAAVSPQFPTLSNCVYPIEVVGVKDAAFFQVEVSRRGPVSYTKADLAAAGWAVHSTLGS
ncbi:MAG: hypothetical protein WKF86_00230 [Acidimicrobiales bacterium]